MCTAPALCWRRCRLILVWLADQGLTSRRCLCTSARPVASDMCRRFGCGGPCDCNSAGHFANGQGGATAERGRVVGKSRPGRMHTHRTVRSSGCRAGLERWFGRVRRVAFGPSGHECCRTSGCPQTCRNLTGKPIRSSTWLRREFSVVRGRGHKEQPDI